MTVEPGQGPKSELFVCWISTVTSKYLTPGVNWGKGEGGRGRGEGGGGKGEG